MGTSTMCGHYVCHVLKEGRYLFVLIIGLTPRAGKMNQNPTLSLVTRSRSGLFFVSRKTIAYFFSTQQILYLPSLLGQDGGIMASFLFNAFMDLDSLSVHKLANSPRSSHLHLTPVELSLYLIPLQFTQTTSTPLPMYKYVRNMHVLLFRV